MNGLVMVLPSELRDLVVKLSAPSVPLTRQSARWFLKVLPSVSRDFKRAVTRFADGIKARQREIQMRAAGNVLSVPGIICSAVVLPDGSLCVASASHLSRYSLSEKEMHIYPPLTVLMGGGGPLHTVRVAAKALVAAHDVLAIADIVVRGAPERQRPPLRRPAPNRTARAPASRQIAWRPAAASRTRCWMAAGPTSPRFEGM